MESNNWDKYVENIYTNYSAILITHKEFENDINKILNHAESPLRGLLYEIKCPAPFKSYKIGKKLKSNPYNTISYTISDNRNTECVMKIWKKVGYELEENVNRLLHTLFLNFWRPELRTPSTGLLDLKRLTDVAQLVQAKLVEVTQQKAISSVLFCDLDNFREVNEQINYEAGDRVIKKFGALLEEITHNDGISLHNGGDEFIIFLPRGNHEKALKFAYLIKQQFDHKKFQINKISLSVSIGIVTNDRYINASSFSKLCELSEEALKKEVKGKKRGIARFYPKQSMYNQRGEIEELLKKAFCLTKSNSLSQNIYNNVWLNLLATFVSYEIRKNEFSFSEIKTSIDNFLNWANLVFDYKLLKTCIARSHEQDISPEVSCLDISMAIAHGIMNSMLSRPSKGTKDRIEIRYNQKRDSVAIFLLPNTLIWAVGNIKSATNKFDLGTIWSAKMVKDLKPESLRRAILIKIGHEDLSIPKEIFSEIIIIDDRPTRGGGLPDFWEATIARLIACLEKNPNILFVFVIGEKKYGAKTINILEQASNWDYDLIQYKTGMPFSLVKKASNQLKNKIQLVEESEIISQLAVKIREYYKPTPIAKKSLIGKEDRFLEREIQTEQLVLKKEDGCRVNTAKEAFPLVLEIARNITDKAIVQDQAGLELLELVDFKVHLKRPLSDRIPDFYINEKRSLDQYFKQEFCSKRGLFGKFLIKSGQLDKVINHLIQAITHSPNPYATRRAILIVPHELKKGKDLSPLGLISIRCIPRFLSGTIILNFSFTWRTVEALVGFPYSLYGSICFSEFMTNEIIKKLPMELRSKIKIGFISYIAHSLHIFMDEYGQNITKKIVDDASK